MGLRVRRFFSDLASGMDMGAAIGETETRIIPADELITSAWASVGRNLWNAVESRPLSVQKEFEQKE